MRSFLSPWVLGAGRAGPRVGAPRLVGSGRSQCSAGLSCRCGVFPRPRGCRPRLYWAAAQGTWRPAGNRALCACRWPLPREGRWAHSASYPFGAPRWSCPWRVPPASVLGCVRCGGLACVDPVTDASGFPYRPSFDGGLGRCTGAVSCGHRHLLFWVGGRHARVCVCVLSLAGLGGPASWSRSGAPHLFLWLSCPSALFGPHQAGVARAFSFFIPPYFCLPSGIPAVSGFLCFPAPGALGLGRLCFCFVLPTPSCFFFPVVFSLLHPPRGPLCCCFWCPGPWRFVVCPPPFSVPPPCFLLLFFFPVVFSLFCAPSSHLPCLGVSVVPWSPGPWRSVSPLLALVFSFFQNWIFS